jgi:hypothetical protein
MSVFGEDHLIVLKLVAPHRQASLWRLSREQLTYGNM